MSTPISIKLLTDAVVTSYIHDISTRHRPDQPTPEDGDGRQAAWELPGRGGQ
jgi:hypothetical protein